MTSANVVEYRIEKDGKTVGHHRQHLMCNDRSDELLKFKPLEEHTITAFGYDEEEEYWEEEPENLDKYLKTCIPINKTIREYFDNN